jgi:hypothetical protein
VRRADHHVLLHEVVREPGGRESLSQLSLAVRDRRDLTDVRIDHRRAHARELAGLEQVLDDVALGSLAVELQEDLVSLAEVLAEPVGRADEASELVGPPRPELVRKEASAGAAGVVQRLRTGAMPQAEATDDHALVSDTLEGLPARGRGLEAVDALEAELRIAHGVERAAVVSADVQEDLHSAVLLGPTSAPIPNRTKAGATGSAK